MSDFSMRQTQTASQVQVQRMSQKQIFALNLISMNGQELRDEIYRFADENPALEIMESSFSEGVKKVSLKNTDFSSVHTGFSSASGNSMSDNFQKMIESSPDGPESLSEHLLSQVRMSRLSEEEEVLCRKLIENLDENGWHILSPESIVDENGFRYKKEFLESCIKKVQSLDPVGLCCMNIEESLEVQAALRDDADVLSLFILHGRLELLSPPDPSRVLKKLNELVLQMEKMSFMTGGMVLDKGLLTLENVRRSINFIKSLDPHPAQGFSAEDRSLYVFPDCLVKVEEGALESSDFEGGLVACGLFAADETSERQVHFRLSLQKNLLPSYRLSPSFADDFRGLRKNAQDFIESIEFRNAAVLRTFSILVSLQQDFFLYGPERLRPLTQKKLAGLAGVHESSISRFADSKYLRCDFGTFPVKYFFTSGIEKKVKVLDDSSDTKVSSNAVKIAIQKIIAERTDGEKRLSDQKISELLAEKGFKVARRTVAKYRQSLDIDSSYTRT